MLTISEVLSTQRKAKRISISRAARDLMIKEEILKALETPNWQNLPEPTIVRGFIKNYANYLGLDSKNALALYRREFDEKKYPQKTTVFEKQKRFKITPTRIINFSMILVVIIFIIYLAIQYSSILKSPTLSIIAPSDDFTSRVPTIVISGKAEKGATVSIDGEFVAVDKDGSFSYQITLDEGQNIIEIIAAKRLSPKTKVTRLVRFSR